MIIIYILLLINFLSSFPINQNKNTPKRRIYRCPGRELNPHVHKGPRPSNVCVCQFHHLGISSKIFEDFIFGNYFLSYPLFLYSLLFFEIILFYYFLFCSFLFLVFLFLFLLLLFVTLISF